MYFLISDIVHFGFEVSANSEAALHLSVVLHPDASAVVATKTWFPGVAVVVGGLE